MSADPQSDVEEADQGSPEQAELQSDNGEIFEKPGFPVIAIGSSAGGVEALRELFDQLPTDGNMAIVLAPHLAPDAPSLLGELVASRTKIPVIEVEDGMRLETNQIFVMPPGMAMFLERHPDGGPEVLKLREFEQPRGHRRPIDDFFKSVADSVGHRAVGIVLSGTGSNGTAGLAAIKAAGGVAVAQEPDTAKFRDMPVHAIRSGMVDRVLAPADIPDLLRTYAGSTYGREGGPGDGVDLGDADGQALFQVLGVLQVRAGREFRPYKKPTLVRRIRRRMGLRRIDAMAEYVDLLRGDPDEVEQLARDLLIHVTEFFRDPPAWEALREKVIGPLVAGAEPGRELRAWVPACSTGEEAYSLAMLLFDAAEAADKALTVRVFATDASPQTLEIARRGEYPNGAMAAVGDDRRGRYFEEHDGLWRITKRVRESIVFAPQDVLGDPPFSRIDVVTCRNLMIYLEPPAQERLLTLMHFALIEGGALFLGNAESVGRTAELYEPIDPRWRIYRRAGGTRRDLLDTRAGWRSVLAEPASMHLPRSQDRLQRYAHRVLIGRFAPPSVIVDRRGQTVFFHGDTAPFLAQPGGEPTRDVLALAREPIGPRLRTLLREAAESRRPATSQVTAPATTTDDGDETRRVEIRVDPLDNTALGEDLLLVSFLRVQAPPPASPGPQPGETDAQTAARHERELREVRDELQVTIEQLETSNEELKVGNEELKVGNEEITSANEELQSTNEELETSKEELQSLNEELNTVNGQLQDKVGELEELTDDLDNLLRSTALATVFLDGELRIKRFTPAVRELMEVIPGDRGRPLANLAFKFDDPALLDDAAEVLRTLQPSSRQITSTDGRTYQRRVLPYRTQDNRIEGVTITFADITELHESRERAEAAQQYAEMIVNTIREPLLVLDPDLTVRSTNRAFFDAFRVEPRQTIGRQVFDLGNAQWDIPELRRLLNDILPERKSVEDYEVTHAFPKIGERIMRLHARQMNEHQLILLAITDVTLTRRLEREQAEQREKAEADRLAAKEAQAANAAKDRFLAALSHELRTPLTPVLLSAEDLCGRDDLPGDLGEQLRLIRDNIRLEARLIDDMLDLTRIARGKLRVDLRPTDAHDVVAAALRSTGLDRANDDDATPSVFVEMGAAEHYADSDAPRLQQVVWNLLTNALKFTPADGRITVATDNPRPGRWRVRVIDTGVGIDPEKLNGIFKAFEQIGDSEGEAFRPQGLGLGLAIARTIVRLHKGEVSAESEGKGQGTAFAVELPTVAEPIADDAAPAADGGLRVLLVEDNDATRKVMAKLLRRQGHSVTTAATGAAAISAARDAHERGEGRFDVLVSDLGLPDFDGIEVLRRLGPYRPRRTIVVSGYGMEADVHRCLTAGYDAHLTKPVEMAALSEALSVPA
jgi:two-component system CheB/CheR fusion protein